MTDQKLRRREVPIPDKPTGMSTRHRRDLLKDGGRTPRQETANTLTTIGLAWSNGDQLRGLAIVSTILDDAIRAEVASLREDGFTPWAQIGASLGMSKQAAQQRYPDVKTD
jgi:hypothetical protein